MLIAANKHQALHSPVIIKTEFNLRCQRYAPYCHQFSHFSILHLHS